MNRATKTAFCPTTNRQEKQTHQTQTKNRGHSVPFLWQNKVVPLTKTYWFTQWLCDASSRLLWFSFQIPKSNSSFTLFLCGGNSPRGTYMFTKLPTVFNIHKSTLHLYLINKQYTQKRKKTNTQTKQKKIHIFIQKYVIRENESTWRLFQTSKVSVQ